MRCPRGKSRCIGRGSERISCAHKLPFIWTYRRSEVEDPSPWRQTTSCAIGQAVTPCSALRISSPDAEAVLARGLGLVQGGITTLVQGLKGLLWVTVGGTAHAETEGTALETEQRQPVYLAQDLL